MKKLLIILASFALTACSSLISNLNYSNKPILNIAAHLAPFIDVKVSEESATIKNKSTQPVDMLYHLYWYDALGITQTWEHQQERYSNKLLLQPQEQKVIKLNKPTLESKNYRLYLQ